MGNNSEQKKGIQINKLKRYKLILDLYKLHKTEDIPTTIVLKRYIQPVYPIKNYTLYDFMHSSKQITCWITNPKVNTMTGNELFHEYTSKRDYTGSEADEYAQLLETIWFHIRNKIFDLLELAEKEGKRLKVLDLTENGKIYRDEIYTTDIIFV